MIVKMDIKTTNPRFSGYIMPYVTLDDGFDYIVGYPHPDLRNQPYAFQKPSGQRHETFYYTLTHDPVLPSEIQGTQRTGTEALGDQQNTGSLQVPQTPHLLPF